MLVVRGLVRSFPKLAPAVSLHCFPVGVCEVIERLQAALSAVGGETLISVSFP